jgi:hypothetical protein
MIVRHEENGLMLITQPAHAWLAGKLAAAWGNEIFAKPSPFEAVILATRLHDIGWLDWDAAPRLGQDGEPLNFLDTNLIETIPIWRQAVRRMTLFDPYAALLVSQHASTIYGRRREREVDPPEQRVELEASLAEHEAIQETFRAQLSDHPVYGPAVEPARLKAAYRWLRACDLLSLALCTENLPAEGVIEAVRGSDPVEFIQIRYRRPKPFELRLDPSPFADTPLQLTIQARFLRETTYPDQAAYAAALEQAPWAHQAVNIHAG